MAKTKFELELRNMKLHETMKAGNFLVMKVLGGWIYWNRSLDNGATGGVFVPNSEESFSMIRKLHKEMKQLKKKKVKTKNKKASKKKQR